MRVEWIETEDGMYIKTSYITKLYAGETFKDDSRYKAIIAEFKDGQTEVLCRFRTDRKGIDKRIADRIENLVSRLMQNDWSSGQTYSFNSDYDDYEEIEE